MAPLAATAFLGGGLLLVAGCQCSPRRDPNGAATDAHQSGEGQRPAYPHAPWRILSWTERDSLVLWVSHILISHREAHPETILRPVSWNPDTRPARSRAEALTLALRVAEQARAHPETFEALARQYSDDEVTRFAGGSLGGVRSTQLPEVFLDALTALQPGDVSGVLETRLGFHILLRRSPPPHEDVDGRHVVIRYAGTVSSIDEGPSARTHEEARALAREVEAQAHDGAAPFESLVRRYSDHADRAVDGDIGTWSTLAPAEKPREIETLARLKIGEVAPPIDTVWGFQVLQRVEPSRHGRLAMAGVRMHFGPLLPPEDPRSRQSVYAQARTLAQRLHSAPGTFAEAHGPSDEEVVVEVWDWGHAPAQLTLALEHLRFGEVSLEPASIPFFFVISMRLDPALTTRAESPSSYELPLRATPNIEQLFHDAESVRLAPRVAGFMRPEVAAAMGLSEPETAVLHSTLAALQKDVLAANTPEARVRGYQIAMKTLHESLPEARYSKLVGVIEREADRILLANQ
jgi:hypothetical protein